VEFLTLVQFSKLVSDSSTSEGIFSLLVRTVVEQCSASHALVFGTSDSGDFRVLSSYGNGDDRQFSELTSIGMGSLAELTVEMTRAYSHGGYDVRAIPLISDGGLLGALVVVFSVSQAPNEQKWRLVEGLSELTAISLEKTCQHQKLQKAFDDLRVSQDALIRTEKFRALGQMSASIAHDLKNLLNPLVLYTDLIRDTADKADEVREISDRVNRILMRGLETVERLREFSRQSPEESEAIPTDLNAIVKEAIEITKPRLGNIELVLALADVPQVLIRPADCVTAIVNFVINAVDALAGKGNITVRTESSNGGASVEVRDNGPGIPSEIQNRILEPFFTTKGESGTGLGVSIVYAFVARHGGRLDIESEPGQGASFKMWFPAV
jgi:signal transduction histidine kinase